MCTYRHPSKNPESTSSCGVMGTKQRIQRYKKSKADRLDTRHEVRDKDEVVHLFKCLCVCVLECSNQSTAPITAPRQEHKAQEEEEEKREKLT